MVDALFPQPLPQHAGQGTGVGFCQIGDHKFGGIQLVAGAHAADDGRVHRLGAADQLHLGRNRVDGVNHIGKCRKIKGIGVFLAEKALPGLHDDGGVDVPDALCHDLHLGPSHGGAQGHDLPVQVALTDGVIIHQQQAAYAGARQRFTGKTAYAAHAEYGNIGVFQLVHTLFAQKQGGAAVFYRYIHRMHPPPTTMSPS